jgi:hypothetical protein
VAVGPRLVQEVTLQPTAIMPTRQLSPTPSPIAIPVATSGPNLITIVASQPDFVLVTSTLPPTKTATLTPSVTPTFTRTLPPTSAALAAFQAATTGPIFGAPRLCDTAWFFSQTALPVCPLNEALTSQGAYQQFQQGLMIWVERQDAIYVVFNSGDLPRWQVFRDNYESGDPENDPNLTPPPAVWQPRRGFGEVWRDQSGVRQRLGWALDATEQPFTTRVQIADDGTIFLADVGGGIIGLSPGGRGWDRYSGS